MWLSARHLPALCHMLLTCEEWLRAVLILGLRCQCEWVAGWATQDTALHQVAIRALAIWSRPCYLAHQ